MRALRRRSKEENVQFTQQTVQIFSPRGINHFPAFSCARYEAVSGEIAEVWGKRVLPHFQRFSEFPGGQSAWRGKQLFHCAQTRDMAQGSEALSEVCVIHSSRIYDMRDSHVTTHYLLKN
jgi:hypothetical protein